jgi:hypothetical protein
MLRPSSEKTPVIASDKDISSAACVSGGVFRLNVSVFQVFHDGFNKFVNISSNL